MQNTELVRKAETEFLDPKNSDTTYDAWDCHVQNKQKKHITIHMHFLILRSSMYCSDWLFQWM